MDNETKILSLEMEIDALKQSLYSACEKIGQLKSENVDLVERNRELKNEIEFNDLMYEQSLDIQLKEKERLNQRIEYQNELLDAPVFQFVKVCNLLSDNGFAGFFMLDDGCFIVFGINDKKGKRFKSIDDLCKHLKGGE